MVIVAAKRGLKISRVQPVKLAAVMAFDISTTVDPCYIVSLIRRLLPSEHGEHSSGNEVEDLQTEGPTTEKGERSVGDTLVDGIVRPHSGNKDEVVHTGETSEESLALGELMDNGLHLIHKHQNGSVEEASWEEHGCALKKRDMKFTL